MNSSTNVDRLDQEIVHRRLALNEAVSMIELLRDRWDKEKVRLQNIGGRSITAQFARGRRHLQKLKDEIGATKSESDEILKLDRKLCDEFSDEAGEFIREFSASPRAVIYRRQCRKRDLRELTNEWTTMTKVNRPNQETGDRSMNMGGGDQKSTDAHRRVTELERKLLDEASTIGQLRKYLAEMETSIIEQRRFPTDDPVLLEKMEKAAQLRESSSESYVRELAEEAVDLRAKFFAHMRSSGPIEDQLPDVDVIGARGRGGGRAKSNSTTIGRGRGSTRARGNRGRGQTTSQSRRGRGQAATQARGSLDRSITQQPRNQSTTQYPSGDGQLSTTQYDPHEQSMNHREGFSTTQAPRLGNDGSTQVRGGRGGQSIRARGANPQRGNGRGRNKFRIGQCDQILATASEAGFRGPRQTLITAFMRREYSNEKMDS